MPTETQPTKSPAEELNATMDALRSLPATVPQKIAAQVVDTNGTSRVVAEVTDKPQSAFMQDIHVNASGLLLFGCVVIGIIWPECKPKTDQIEAAAATYLFAAIKSR